MSYTLKQLTPDQLVEVNKLTQRSLKIDTNIKWSQKEGYNADNTFLPVKYNVELANYINTITGFKSKDITSLHFIRYNEGKNLTRHKDEYMLDIKNPTNSTSIIFLLSMCEQGGEFLLDDEDVGFNTPGQYISFDGQATYHEVKEVKKGIREVLVLWYRPKTVTSLF
jgi:predicted 2-oxoglutarate/Fe(II)-dependent dioxygenase YbiX